MPSPDSSTLYYVGDVSFEPSRPRGTQNLTELYGLTPLAQSVARFNPLTGEKRKLRKSYKNQIGDLIGKHMIPGPGETPNNWSLVNLARQPPKYDTSRAAAPPELKPLDDHLLVDKLSFEKSPAAGIPDFDVTLLAADFGSTASQRSVSPEDAANMTTKKFGAGASFTKRLSTAASDSAMTAGSSNDDSIVNKKRKKKRYKDGVDKRQHT